MAAGVEEGFIDQTQIKPKDGNKKMVMYMKLAVLLKVAADERIVKEKLNDY